MAVLPKTLSKGAWFDTEGLLSRLINCLIILNFHLFQGLAE
jgi:hypothetical protein